MREKIVSFLKGNFFPLVIVLITVYLSWANSQPGTWLSGWDTLHPEFNFPLNFKRVIDGVWREEQGLGVVAGHSHMGDLPRMIILFLSSFILPVHWLRYLFTFLTIIVGPLGIYYFLERAILKNQPVEQKKPASFLGALFYLLNLGTLQHYYVTFEMFSAQFAALGWLFLFATRFLERRKKKDFLFFSIVTVLATPQAFAATLWYAYFIALTLYLAFFSLPTLFKKNFKISRRAVILLAATLIINSFWLLPNIYFILHHSWVVPEAKTNRLFSEEAFLHTRHYGNLIDTAIIKNYLFNWVEHDGQGNFQYLLDEWIKHLENPFVLAIGYFGFIFVVGGIIFSLWKRKNYSFPLLAVFLLGYIFLINATPPFSWLFNYARENFLTFRESLRFPFTKFSILLIFSYATYFGIGFSYLLSGLRKIIKQKLVVLYLIVILFTAGLIYYMLPAFQGYFISPSMRIKIPQEYFQMFKWFNQQENGRVAKLPIHTFWGWVYHDWGFQGAGFIWYGIKQPILDRDSDRWTPYNEQSYREMAYALYSQNLPLLEQIFEKYQIRWLFLDESVIDPGSEVDILFYDETKAMLNASDKVRLVQTFGEKLGVYAISLTPVTEISPSFQLAKTEKIDVETAEAIIRQAPSKLGHLVTYQSQPKLTLPLDLSQIQLTPELCSDTDTHQVFGVENSVVCLKIPVSLILRESLKQESLIEVKYEYQSETSEKPLVCLFDNRLGRCTGQRFPDNYFELEKELDNYQLQFALDAIDSQEEKYLIYKNIELAIYEPLDIVEPNSLIQEASYFNITALNRQPRSCGGPEALQLDRKIIEENGERFIE
ncbi:hypothetical protein AMJ51_02060, partial [Microgenomates bacterium DG_75]